MARRFGAVGRGLPGAAVVSEWRPTRKKLKETTAAAGPLWDRGLHSERAPSSEPWRFSQSTSAVTAARHLPIAPASHWPPRTRKK